MLCELLVVPSLSRVEVIVKDEEVGYALRAVR